MSRNYPPVSGGTASGLTVRGAINNVLAALQSCFSGAGDDSSAVIGQITHNETTDTWRAKGNTSTKTLATTDQLTSTPSQGGYRNLKASCTGLSASITMTADKITATDASGNCTVLSSVSLTLNTATTGAGGMQAAIAVSTWYAWGVIYNPTTLDKKLFGWPIASAPTLPSGYTQYFRCGAFRSDATANKYPLAGTWAGAKFAYKVTATGNVQALPVMASGSSGAPTTPSFTTLSVSAYAPSTALEIDVTAYDFNSNGLSLVAPNNAYGTRGGANPPIMLGTGSSTYTTAGMSRSLVLESTNLYYASTSSTFSLSCYGYLDSI